MKKFTLIELLVVVAIIGILASILMPSLSEARRKSKIAVCLSNQKQVATGGITYLIDSDDFFPYPKFTGGGLDSNSGRFWIGKKGSGNWDVNVTQRPVNDYIGYSEDDIEVPLALCPLNLKKREYTIQGTNYMAAARNEHLDDLDTANSSITASSVNKTNTMVMFGEVGAWHYSNSPTNPWKEGTFWHKPGNPVYSFSFIDGHAINQRISGGMGISAESKVLNFRNF